MNHNQIATVLSGLISFSTENIRELSHEEVESLMKAQNILHEAFLESVKA